MVRTYSELITFPTLESRFDYLALHGGVGHATFGSRRFLNQGLYSSREWRDVRDWVKVRDNGCDLALPGHTIFRRPTVHHLEPITEQDILNRSRKLLDPENLVLVAHMTHEAIHYGDVDLLPKEFVERREGDTKEW